MSSNDYYGAEETSSVSYLEFGAFDLKRSTKDVWDFRLHQKAYDWLMNARYANDLVTYLRLKEMLESDAYSTLAALYAEEMHHPNDASLNLSKLCALAALQDGAEGRPASFWELGQTLFGCIEGMSFCQALLQRLSVDMPSVNLHEAMWYGLDISDFFNRLSRLMHADYKVTTTTTTDAIPDGVDVFFAKGVTLLYACPQVDRLLALMQRARCSLFDYSFALGGAQTSKIGTGKTVTYLDYEEVAVEVERAGFAFHVRCNRSSFDRETGRMFVECLVGDSECVQRVQSLDIGVREALAKEALSEPSLTEFKDFADPAMNEWIPIKDWVQKHCS
jgi:hypothetical protein